MLKKVKLFKNDKYNIEKEVELEIFDGFNSGEVFFYLSKMRINIHYVAIVKFLDMYYAVWTDGIGREIVIGKEAVFYRDGFDFTKIMNPDLLNFRLPFPIRGLNKMIFKNQKLYSDLKEIDDNLSISVSKYNTTHEDVSKYKYSKSFVVLLAISFFETFFTREETVLLEDYFDIDFFSNFDLNPTIKAMNPFNSKVMYIDGTIQSRFLSELIR